MEKHSAKPLHGMFESVPPRYDIINRIVTLGLDASWRCRAARRCLEGQPQRVLDLGCGTGDLLLEMAFMRAPGTRLTGLDFSTRMLKMAEKKLAAHSQNGQIDLVQGDAGALPFADGEFDTAGISFAFRNLTYKNPLAEKHLAEVRRVLKTGGRFVIVESSQPGNCALRWAFHLYLRFFVYPAGSVISGNRPAYHYLAESARRFFTPAEVRAKLLAAGFADVSYEPLLGGVAGLHVAVK